MTSNSDRPNLSAASQRRADVQDGNHGRNVMIALIAFLTVVDLFATQAILPTLQQHYGATPAAMSVAVNASTIGMAVAGLLVAVFPARIDRRLGVIASLLLLSVPTVMLAHAPDLPSFTALRIVQGVCMASAFSLTLAHLGEAAMTAEETTAAFAAYVTGNVASNLFGRLLSSGLADFLGLSVNFYAFAALNLAGAGLAAVTIRGAGKTVQASPNGARAGALQLVHRPALRLACMVGFCILFVFVGVFTFVNFVLVRPPLSVSPMSLGLVYLVFLPSIITTPLVGKALPRFGPARVLTLSLALAGIGLPLLLVPHLVAVLLGLVVVAVGTFCAQ